MHVGWVSKYNIPLKCFFSEWPVLSAFLDTSGKMLRLVREDIAKQNDEEKFFVDKNVFGLCWGEIKRWLNWSSLISHMIQCSLTSDFTELLQVTKK